MTENTTYTVPTDEHGALQPVTPAGVDLLDDLTAGELGHIGKLIGYDPVSAIKRPEVGLRYPALAHVAWVWAKRTDPRAKLTPFMELTATQLSTVLRLDEPAQETDELDAEANPTDSQAVS